MRRIIVFLILLLIKTLGRIFYTYDWQWLGEVGERPWRDFRLVAILNHTSLYECLLAGGVPNSFLWRMAGHGVVPVAEVTMERPLVGRFFRLIAGHVVSISRERDHTWEKVMRSIDPRSMVVILPEGRMKRGDGLDKNGRPMTVRSGIADLIEATREGELLIAYNPGLHHIQIPDESLFPKLFKTIRLKLEILDVAEYRRQMHERGGGTPQGFRRAVVADMTARRDRYCHD